MHRKTLPNPYYMERDNCFKINSEIHFSNNATPVSMKKNKFPFEQCMFSDMICYNNLFQTVSRYSSKVNSTLNKLYNL